MSQVLSITLQSVEVAAGNQAISFPDQGWLASDQYGTALNEFRFMKMAKTLFLCTL